MLEHLLGSGEPLTFMCVCVCFPPLGTTDDWHVGTHVILLLSLSSLGGGGKKEKMKRWEGIKCVIQTQLSGSVAMGGSEDRG